MKKSFQILIYFIAISMSTINALAQQCNSICDDLRDNTSLGINSGTNNVGVGNAFFGESTGVINQGNFNSFFGFDAGKSNQVSNSNSFFGHKTGELNNTGFRNAFFGAFNGTRNTSGSENSFFGQAAGNNNLDGHENSFFGQGTGNGNMTGSRNSYFGKEAGKLNQTGSGNLFLGYQAGYNETSSNKLYIANDSLTPLIYGEFDNKLLRINGALEVSNQVRLENLPDVQGNVLVVDEEGNVGKGSIFRAMDEQITNQQREIDELKRRIEQLETLLMKKE